MPLALLLAIAAGQDMPGAIDLPSLARSQVQAGAMQGHADRDGARMVTAPDGVALSATSRAYCESYPALRRRHGARDARVVRLAAACRRAGYPY